MVGDCRVSTGSTSDAHPGLDKLDHRGLWVTAGSADADTGSLLGRPTRTSGLDKVDPRGLWVTAG